MALHSGPIVLAHPLTQRYELPLSPAFVAAVALCVVAGAAYLFWYRFAPAPAGARPDPQEPRGRTPTWFLTRLGGMAMFALAVAAGLLGDESNLRNITTALVIGAGWPLLVLASLVAGHVWCWIDPFDSLARIGAPLGAGDPEAEASPPVWWAVAPGTLLVTYLTVWPNNLAPRSVAVALLVYALVTMAGSMAVGRRLWVRRADIFRLFFGSLARARRPSQWHAPEGMHLVLAVVSGGLLFGLLRDSQLLVGIGYGARGRIDVFLALAVTIVAVVVIAFSAQRREAGRGAPAAISLALAWSSAGLAIALALARNRFTTSLQLLPQLAQDPLGARNPLTEIPPLYPAPLGVTGLLLLQVLVLLGFHVAAAAAAARYVRRHAPREGSPPALSIVSVLLCVGVAAVAATALTP